MSRLYRQLSPNIDSQLEIEFYCMKHCWGIYEQNSIVNNDARVYDWTHEWAMIASNGK